MLIVGGVSGSTAQQVLKHPAVEKLDIVELDGRVLAICNQFFPTIAAIFEHSKVNLLPDDAIEYLQKNENLYDVIIADTPEPMGSFTNVVCATEKVSDDLYIMCIVGNHFSGPSTGFARENFFSMMKKALRPGGVISVRASMPGDTSLTFNRYGSPKFFYLWGKEIFGNAALAYVHEPDFDVGFVRILVASTNGVRIRLM